MVKSTAPDVDAYLAELPAERRPAATAVRALCRTELNGYTETMAYGMPVYRYDGRDEVAFAVQRDYFSFYLLREDIRAEFAQRLAGRDMGKGCLRFRHAAGPDLDLLTELVRAVAGTPGGPVC
ncbi:DUF1801 domain-containing protein [Nocardia sp. NPDC024068]|uniref:iron chaperone n=1 Tax=Nocardia sp. NPDC024068 TaxID=3157197 RepID=UPI0033F1315D